MPDAQSDPVIIYTDGCAIPNPGDGGWAAILLWREHRREMTGQMRDTTNNRMEMLAAISALEALKRPCPVILYTDSEYLRLGITQWSANWIRRNWMTAAKEPVKNVDLWKRLLAAVERHNGETTGVEWRWLKGHAGNTKNERADVLASNAARSVTYADPVDVAAPIASPKSQ